ncbi:multiple epidermal growth factor-like domains protein 10, partial [Saccostrea cucullata]|uniref:multiple epidermal growth factor-like domains protein 10 n=1 Tax=Saccostrea cuccullata TaxID=36930 RepID=UPI002ED04AD3
CDAGSWGKHCSNVCNCGGANCNPVTGGCLCPPGKIGHHCEQECGASYFGFQCAQQCGCQNNGVCDKVTGECTCQPGWSGTFCDQKCPDGMYGADCSNQCPDCLNGGSCDSITGLCLCAAGYKGNLCNQTCDPGTWGTNCQSYCPSLCKQNCVPTTGECPCHQGACLNGGICKQGKCVCQYGFFGDDCSQSLGRTLASQKSLSSPSNVTLTPGQVVGIVMGLLVLILLVVLLTIFIMRRRFHNQQNNITSMNLNNSLHEDSDVRGFTNPHYDVQHSDNMADTSGGKTEAQSEDSATA